MATALPPVSKVMSWQAICNCVEVFILDSVYDDMRNTVRFKLGKPGAQCFGTPLQSPAD